MRKNIKDFADIHHHSTDLLSNHDEDKIVNLNSNDPLPQKGYYSIGIHPWATQKMNIPDIDEAIKLIKEKAKDEKVVAIGECGIDKLRGGEADLQEYAFRQQIKLSELLGLPLIIHMVKSADEILRLKKELQPRQLWIIHGFRGKPQLASQLIREGIALSFGKYYNEDSLLSTPEYLRFFETDDEK